MPVRREEQGLGRVWVKKSARGLSLRIDGTHASWYEPGSPATGSVWDALVVPLLLLPASRRRKVLILGLGGGSAARLVRAIAPTARIVGVEFDADVIEVAKREFGLDELDLEVVQGDARAYLARTRRHFDLVIDDIFIGKGRSVRKPLWMLEEGVDRAAKRVAAAGILVSNTIDETAAIARTLRRHFPSTVSTQIEGYDNRVLAAGAATVTAANLRRAAAAEPLFARVLPALHWRSR